MYQVYEIYQYAQIVEFSHVPRSKEISQNPSFIWDVSYVLDCVSVNLACVMDFIMESPASRSETRTARLDREWEPVKADLTRLWWDENRDLEDVMAQLRQRHGFEATHVSPPPLI